MTIDAPGGVVLRVDGRAACRVVFVVCVVLELTFVVLDYHVNYGRLTDIGALRRLTNIAREDGLASWFASTQTLLVGLTAWVFLWATRARASAVWRRRGWLLVAALFIYMAIDDGAQIHERAGTVFRVLYMPDAASSIFPSFTWQLLFVPVFGVLGLLVAVFLWRELANGRSRVLIVVALLLFAVAVALDFVEGLNAAHPWNLHAALAAGTDLSDFTEARFEQSAYETLRHFSRSLEEFCEMLATTCIWTAIVWRAGALLHDVRLQTTPS